MKYPWTLSIAQAAALLVLAATSLHAEVLVLDEDAAAALAAEKDTVTASARVDALAGERRVGIANNFLLPSLTAGVAVTEQVTSEVDATMAGVARLSSVLNLSASDFKAKDTIAREARALSLQERAAVERIERDARTAFYRLILLSQQVSLAESAVEVAREGAERTAVEYRNGLSSERVKRQSEVYLEIEKLALERIRAELTIAMIGFRSLLGIPEGTELSLAGDLEAPPFVVDRSMVADLSLRTDLALVAARLAVQESLRAEDRLTRRVPSLSLSAVASSTVADLFPGAGADPLSDRAVSAASLTVTLSSPNLTAFLPFSKEVETSAKLRDAEIKLGLDGAELLRKARIEVETLLAELEVSRLALDSLKEALSLADEVVSLTTEAYAVGAASYQDLRIAEKDLDKARLDAVEERYRYLSTIIDLEYAVGRRLRPAKE